MVELVEVETPVVAELVEVETPVVAELVEVETPVVADLTRGKGLLRLSLRASKKIFRAFSHSARMDR